MAQAVQLKYDSVLNGLIIIHHDSNHNVGKDPFVYKQTYLTFTSISRLLFNAVVYLAYLRLRQEVMTRQCMT